MNLKDWREAKGLSQLELAGMLRVRQTTVSAWERGEAFPRKAMLTAIQDLTGGKVKPASFL